MFLRRSKVAFKQAITFSTSVDPINVKSVSYRKPFDQIPGPKGLPFIGTYLDYIKPGGFRFNKLFQAMHARSKEYGPIFKENIGGQNFVVISDIEEYAKIVKIDGKYPEREKLLPFWHFKKVNKIKQSFSNTQGLEWWVDRQVVNSKLMKPQEIIQHIDGVDEVVSDFLEQFPTGFNSQQDPVTTDKEGSFVRSDFHETLFLFSLESAGKVLFGARFGCLEPHTPKFAEKFIKDLKGTFEGLQTLLFGIPFYLLYPTKTWNEFEKNYSGLLDNGMEILKANWSKKTNSSDLLSYLISQSSDPEDINHTMIDILNGAVETTAYTILWNLYCISRNKDVQETLYREALTFLPNANDKVTGDIFNELKYVKSCVKESFRLYPVAVQTSRIISTNVEICGYELPSGV